MKNTNKLSSRIAAIFLAMMMLVSLFPAAAFAEGEPPLPETPPEPTPILAQEDEGQTAEDKTQPGEQPTLEPTGEPTAVPEPEETQKPEPEETKEPESGQTQEPESEQAQQPQPKPAPAYATQAELDAAFEAVGVADELEAVTAAVEAYIAVYNRLSPQDQAANAEALAYAQSYLETLRQAAAAGQTGEEFTDPEIETMAQLKGEKFTVRVVKVVNGNIADSKTLTMTCLYSTGHSGYNPTQPTCAIW